MIARDGKDDLGNAHRPRNGKGLAGFDHLQHRRGDGVPAGYGPHRFLGASGGQARVGGSHESQDGDTHGGGFVMVTKLYDEDISERN